MIQNVSCLLCSEENNSFELIHEKIRYSHPGKIYKCNVCDLMFLYPRLNDAEQKKYYSGQYRDDYEEVSIQKRFSNDMFEAKRRFEDIKKIVPSTGSVLEVGSGSGAFLWLSSEYFSEVCGIELDIKAQKFLLEKKLNIYSDLSEIGNKKFDAIVMFHVLEHLLDPVEFISKLSKNLKESGKLIIEVPNVQDALVHFYNIKEFKDFYFCSAHLSYFSSKTLKYCLQKANFNGNVSFIQRYDLQNHLNWLKFKSLGESLGNENIFSVETLKFYEDDLRKKGLSDTLWGIFEKCY